MRPEPVLERSRFARRLFAGIAGEYDRMGAVLSFGQDGRWRRFLASRIPRGARVLDVATGTGLVARELVRRREAWVVGLDQSVEMIRAGLARSRRPADGGHRWHRVVVGRAERLPFADATFDALTFTYLLRYVADPGATLAELARVVRPGGVVAALEFGVPPNPVARALWRAHTRVGLPTIGGLASREWVAAGRFLGPSIEDHWRRYPQVVQARWWRDAGLERVRVRRMSLGGGIVTWAVRGG